MQMSTLLCLVTVILTPRVTGLVTFTDVTVQVRMCAIQCRERMPVCSLANLVNRTYATILVNATVESKSMACLRG